MYCIKCGTTVKESQETCTKCGRRLNRSNTGGLLGAFSDINKGEGLLGEANKLYKGKEKK
jgi:hypothetical protein